ncbi:MAG: heme exporter protein CcmB [Ignavibacteriaceae bacterium]|nr:heme exporter protein CcmB [Ignavibacteriaceae bacterium]
MEKAFWLFKKDIASELRTRYAINAQVMFIVVTISVILFSIGNEKITNYLAGGLFWVVVFFTAMSGLSRAFVSEEERGTSFTLQLIASPSTVLGGKLLFNLILVFSMNLIIAFLYSALFETFVIKNLPLFITAFILGNTGTGIAATLIAAIIAKANTKGTLYPVLSFPILLPLFLTLVEVTKQSMDGSTFSDVSPELAVLVCYIGIMSVAGFMLFDFIWKD